jgi:hypothetical protein
MVRKGSPVRVRQRASETALQRGFLVFGAAPLTPSELFRAGRGQAWPLAGAAPPLAGPRGASRSRPRYRRGTRRARVAGATARRNVGEAFDADQRGPGRRAGERPAWRSARSRAALSNAHRRNGRSIGRGGGAKRSSVPRCDEKESIVQSPGEWQCRPLDHGWRDVLADALPVALRKRMTVVRRGERHAGRAARSSRSRSGAAGRRPARRRRSSDAGCGRLDERRARAGCRSGVRLAS